MYNDSHLFISKTPPLSSGCPPHPVLSTTVECVAFLRFPPKSPRRLDGLFQKEGGQLREFDRGVEACRVAVSRAAAEGGVLSTTR